MPAAHCGCGSPSSCRGMAAVWHWELPNGARVYTDGCFAPADGSRPVPLIDFRHDLSWISATGEALDYGRLGSDVAGWPPGRAGPGGRPDPWRGGTGGGAALRDLVRLNEMVLRTDDGQRHGHLRADRGIAPPLLPVARAERLPPRG